MGINNLTDCLLAATVQSLLSWLHWTWLRLPQGGGAHPGHLHVAQKCDSSLGSPLPFGILTLTCLLSQRHTAICSPSPMCLSEVQAVLFPHFFGGLPVWFVVSSLCPALELR